MGHIVPERSMMKVKRTLVSFLAALALAGAGAVWAAPPAPQFMPNFPMLAGPQVMLMWLPVAGAAKYNVYMNDQKIAEVTAVQHFMPSPDKPGQYVFAVSAVDAQGAESPKTAGKAIAIIKLEAPKNLSFLPRGTVAAVRWDKPLGAVIFNVYLAEAKEGPFQLKQSVQVEKADIADLKAGKTYYVKVSSKDMAGTESAMSDPLEVAMSEEGKGEAVAEVPKRIAKPLWRVKELDLGQGKQKTPPFSYIDVDEERGILYALSNNVGVKLNLDDGRLLGTFGKAYKTRESWEDATPQLGELFEPSNLRIGLGGNLYIASSSGQYVQIFDADGKALSIRYFPPPEGSKAKDTVWIVKFDRKKTPFLVNLVDYSTVGAISKYDEAVFDTDNPKPVASLGPYMWFDPKIKKDRQWNAPVGKFEFNSKNEMILGDDGLMYFLAVDTTQMKVLRRWGGKGGKAGEYNGLAAIGIDGRDNVYGFDFTSGICQVFDNEGKLLFVITNEKGEQLEQGNPRDAYVTKDGKRFFVAEPLVPRISAFEITDQLVK